MAQLLGNQSPLEGLRIIDMSTYIAGPSATMTLAQLGADVIRIDPIGGSTDCRRLPLSPGGSSLYWAGLNKAKRSVEVNTLSGEGRELVGALIAASGPEGGILLTNTVGQPWLAYESMRQYRDDLIEIHIAGRDDGKPAIDHTINCEIGLPLITGPADSIRPVNHVLPAWDFLTGLHSAIAILAAERIRRVSGYGQLVTLSLADVAVATLSHLGMVADAFINGSKRVRDGNYFFGGFGCDFATSDQRRVMVVALTNSHWNKLLKLTGLDEAVSTLGSSMNVNFDLEEARYLYREVLEALIRPWFEQRTFDQVSANLDEVKLLWGAYRSVEDLVTDPTSLLNGSGIMCDVLQPGIGTYPIPRPVLGFSEWDAGAPSPAPVLGHDTDSVLNGLLGLTEQEIVDLRTRNVVGGAR